LDALGWAVCFARSHGAAAEAAPERKWEAARLGDTAGVRLVVSTSAIMTLGALALGSLRCLPRWLRAIGLLVLLVDIVGKGFAAWFLELNLAAALTGLALLDWFSVSDRRPTREPTAHRLGRKGCLSCL
jgi:hypothetical protein